MSDSAPAHDDRPADDRPATVGDVPLPALAPWALVRIRPDGTIAGWNAAAAELFGIPTDDAVGRPYTALADASARGGLVRAVGAVLAGRPAASRVVPVRRGDGTAVMTLWTAVPTRDAAGAVTGLLATGLRLPAIAVGEPERAAAQFWRGVFDANPVAVAVLDADDHVLGVNPRFTELFGYAEGEVLGRPLHAVLGADDRGVMRGARLLAVGERLTFNAERRTKAGERLPVHVEAAGFEAEDGSRGVVVAYRRLVDEGQFEEQLLSAQRMEGVALLASGALHDMNNLLTVVVGQVEALAAAPLAAEWQEDLALLRDAARRAGLLARTVGAFASRGGTRPERVDLRHVVERLRPVLAQLVGRAVALELDLGDAPAVVDAVPAELEQMLVNLAVNARDAMPRGGALRVRVRVVDVDRAAAPARGVRPGTYAALEVADTGGGMSAELARRAFEPFFTTKRASGGTGLGLATVQRITRRLNGAVWIETAEDAGTTFHLLIPTADQAN